MTEKKSARFAEWREDGEPGVKVTHKLVQLEESKVFDTVAEAATFLEMEPEDLLDYLEGVNADQ